MWPIAERRAKTDFAVRTANSKGRRAVLFLFRLSIGNAALLKEMVGRKRDLVWGGNVVQYSRTSV
jgi:hypothetical protein